MKAAVLKQLGSVPEYDDFEEPAVSSTDEVLMDVHAVALKNIDKLVAGGSHYASYKTVPVVVGTDGVGTLENGTRVYARGKTGTLAEKTVLARDQYVELPENIDWATASALPNAAMGSYLPLKVKAEMKKGDVVLINGGTGVTGKTALQLAKRYGASRVIVMGHISGREEKLKSLGADELISSRQGDETITKQLNQINNKTPIDHVIDYLWSHPTALIINSLAGEGADYPEHFTNVISVGAMAGDEIKLSSNTLRSSKIEITGAGLGSYTAEDFKKFNRKVLPDIFQLAAEGKLKLDTQVEKLEDIAQVWNKNAGGNRLVVSIEAT